MDIDPNMYTHVYFRYTPAAPDWIGTGMQTVPGDRLYMFLFGFFHHARCGTKGDSCCCIKWCVKGFSHRAYVELRSAAYRLRRAYAALHCAYAGLRGNIRRGTQRGTRDGLKQLNMLTLFAYFRRRALDAESTQFLRKSTQHYATVRHAYAIERYPTPVRRKIIWGWRSVTYGRA